MICTHYSLELLITGMIFIFLVKLLGQWYFIKNNLNNAVAVTIDPGLSRQWGYLGLIFGSSCVYAGVALALAVKMFNREDVIFRT